MTDADALAFTVTGPGTTNLDVVPDAPSALDAKVGIYASDGTLLALSDGSANAQQLSIALPVGTYYAIITPHGGYDDLGQYVITQRSLPAGWASQDFWPQGIFYGSAGYNPGSNTFTVSGAGINNSNFDGAYYAFDQLSGDGSITARLVSLTTNDGTPAGSDDPREPGHQFAAGELDVVPSASGAVEFVRRSVTGATPLSHLLAMSPHRIGFN